MGGFLDTLGSMLGGSISLGGSMGSSKGSSVSTVNSTATQEGKSTTDASTTAQTAATSMDAASKALLDAFTQQLAAKQGTGGTGYSKQDAITDVAGTIKNIFSQYREQELPQIIGQMGLAGAYNNTSAQFLANDAFAEAVAKGANATVSAIKDYAGITRDNEQAFQAALLNAFQLQSEAVKSGTTTESGSSTSTSNIKETSTSTATEQSKSKSKGLSLGLKF